MSNKFQILCKFCANEGRAKPMSCDVLSGVEASAVEVSNAEGLLELCRVQPKLYNFKNSNFLNCLNIRYLNFENYLLFVF